MEELFVNGYKLPKSLSKEEQEELFIKLNNGDKYALDNLIESNIRLVVYRVITKFNTIKCDKNDLVQVGVIGLLKAIKSFNISKNIEFKYYAIKCIDNEILMFIQKQKRHKNTISIDDLYEFQHYSDDSYYDKLGIISMKKEIFLLDDYNIELEYEKEIIYEIIRNIINDLPNRESEIIKLYFGFYGEKYNQLEIARKLNLTQSGVCRILKRTLMNIKGELISRKLVEIKTLQ